MRRWSRAADQLIAEANAQPGAAEGLCRGPAAGAAGQSDDRPRKGRRVRRHLRGHQQHDLDQSRLELHQRLPEPRPHAARDRAGRPRQPHERRRHPATTTSRTAAASWCRSPRSPPSQWSKGPTQIAGFNYYPAGAHLAARPSPASPPATRSPRWSGSRASCRAASATNGPDSRCRKSCRARRRRSCSASRCWWCSCARRALRKLDHSARGAADGAARHLRRGDRRDAARPAERRLFHRRPDHHHRPGGKERHPDHRVRQGSARAGQAAGRGDDRSLLAALPPDPDDRPRLRLRRAADGDRAPAPAAPASRRSAPA